MEANEKLLILDYLRTLINSLIEQEKYLSLTQLARKIQIRFPKIFKEPPTKSTIHKYMTQIGYRCDKSSRQYVPLKDIDIDGTQLYCYDQPFTTVIKTALADLENIKRSIMTDFYSDIIHIHSEKTDTYGVLIIYSTKYNFSSSFLRKLEHDTQERYGDNENDD